MTEQGMRFRIGLLVLLALVLLATLVTLFGDGEQTRDFTYVENVVEANVMALATAGVAGRVYNIACGGRVTLNELAMSIPQSVKTRNGVLKYILKKAVRGVIPDELIDRKKQGFGVPIFELFWGRLGNEAAVQLERFCKRTDYFDRAEVERLVTKERGPKLWYVLNFALWWNHYIAQDSSSAMLPEPQVATQG